MHAKRPLYDTFEHGASGTYGIKVVRSFDELLHVIAIRSAVFISEQSCPLSEEFDGNDFCATHIVGYKGNEPIACIRVRCFAEFAKIERLAVRHEYRQTRIGFNLVWAAIELARKKGYTKIYGHAQDRLVKFWSHFGAKPLTRGFHLIFSDFSYTEMLLTVAADEDAITLDCDPYIIIRPEGAWHKPGILEESAHRPITSPLRNLKAA